MLNYDNIVSFHGQGDNYNAEIILYPLNNIWYYMYRAIRDIEIGEEIVT